MNQLQKKVVERAHYLADRNEGAVFRTIHGGKPSPKELIDEYEALRARIAESEFALPVEDYMRKVQLESLAKDKIKDEKRMEVVESLGLIPEKERSMKKEKPLSERLREVSKSVDGESSSRIVTKDKLIRSIGKRVDKIDIATFMANRGWGGLFGKEGEEEWIFPDVPWIMAHITRKGLLQDLRSDWTDKDGVVRKFSKAELKTLLDTHGGSVGKKAIMEGIIKKKNDGAHHSVPDKPSPILAEQAERAADAGFPGNHYDGDRLKKMQDGLKVYRVFARDFKDLKGVDSLADKKKALKQAYTLYKKIKEEGGTHDDVMDKVEAIHKKLLDKFGGGGEYCKNLQRHLRSI